MAYDEALAGRIRTALSELAGTTEKKMFGGIAFMLNGNMCCGVVKEDLMVRLAPDRSEEALQLPHARPMDFTGRPMKGFVFVGSDALKTERMLKTWVDRGVTFASSLPPRKPKRSSTRAKA